MNFELRDLKWALVASQNKSLRKAADYLSIRQSTLSRTLRALEDQLGAPLFKRTSGGTHPTQAGNEFLQSARIILDEVDSLAKRLRTRSRGESGRISIGIHSSLSAGNLRATIIEHHKRLPDVEQYFTDGSSDYLISSVSKSTIDIAFVIEGAHKWLDRHLPVWSERVVIALSESHSLAAGNFLEWPDLLGEVILAPQRGPGIELTRLFINRTGVHDTRHVQEHDVSLDSLLTLVSTGTGVLVALEGATGLNYPGVVFREVQEADGPARLGFHAIWRDDNTNPSLRSFLEILRERYPDLSSSGK